MYLTNHYLFTRIALELKHCYYTDIHHQFDNDLYFVFHNQLEALDKKPFEIQTSPCIDLTAFSMVSYVFLS